MRLSPTLSWYIARQFLLAFVGVLLSTLGVVFLFDSIELIRRAGNSGISFGNILGMAVLKLPQMAHTIMPFAVMLSAMVTFWRLTRTHELVVARAAGISVWQFLFPVLLVMGLLGIAEVLGFNPVATMMYHQFEKRYSKLYQEQSGGLKVFDSGFWMREGSGNQQMVMNSGRVRQKNDVLNMIDISIFFHDEKTHLTRRVSARSGLFQDGKFILNKVWDMEVDMPSVYKENMEIPTSLTIEKINDNFGPPDGKSFWQLPGFISFLEEGGFSAVRHRIYFHSLLVAPLMYCSMVLIASIFSLKPNVRSGGVLGRIGMGVLVGFGIYFFMKIMYAFGASSILPQFLAVWSPPIVAGLIGLAGLFHLEDG